MVLALVNNRSAIAPTKLSEHCNTWPNVLILDELGYLPLTRDDASLFFHLVVRRYERASLIVTSNKSLLDWGEVFSDQVLATAILDRLQTKPQQCVHI